MHFEATGAVTIAGTGCGVNRHRKIV